VASKNTKYPKSRARLGALAIALALAAITGACGDDGTESGAATVEVGIMEIAKLSAIDDAVAAFQEELESSDPSTEYVFHIKNANEDQGLIASISRDFASSDYDMFAVVGTSAIVSLAQQVKDRPIIAIAMSDPIGAKVAESLEEPGGNVTGSTDFVDPAILLDVLAGTTPAPKRIGTIYNPASQNAAVWMEYMERAKVDAGVEVVAASVSGPNDVTAAARSLDGRVDAILVGADTAVLAATEAVGAIATSIGVPLYVIGGDVSVVGVAASIGPNYSDLGTLAGEAAREVLDGTSAGEVAFRTPQEVETVTNPETLEALGLAIPEGS
jgi:putative ABC transport system substrate-binding protein